MSPRTDPSKSGRAARPAALSEARREMDQLQKDDDESPMMWDNDVSQAQLARDVTMLLDEG